MIVLLNFCHFTEFQLVFPRFAYICVSPSPLPAPAAPPYTNQNPAGMPAAVASSGIPTKHPADITACKMPRLHFVSRAHNYRILLCALKAEDMLIRSLSVKIPSSSQSRPSDPRSSHAPAPWYHGHGRSLHRLSRTRNRRLRRTEYRSHPVCGNAFRYFLCHQTHSCISWKALHNTFSAPSFSFLESGSTPIFTGASAGWK